jgi:hypothetical protein
VLPVADFGASDPPTAVDQCDRLNRTRVRKVSAAFPLVR